MATDSTILPLENSSAAGMFTLEGLDKPKSPVLQDDSSSEGETDTDSSDQSTEEESTDDSDDPDYGNEWEMPMITSIKLREKYHRDSSDPLFFRDKTSGFRNPAQLSPEIAGSTQKPAKNENSAAGAENPL